MSTTVPIVAIGGMTLHPGPNPFAAGPGPFPLRSRSPSSADAVAAKPVIVRAAENAMAPRNRRKRSAAGQGSRIRRLLIVGDMFPRPSDVYYGPGPEHDPTRGAFPQVWNRAQGLRYQVCFHTQLDRRRASYISDPVEFSCRLANVPA